MGLVLGSFLAPEIDMIFGDSVGASLVNLIFADRCFWQWCERWLLPSLLLAVVMCWLRWAPAPFLLAFGSVLSLLVFFFCVGRHAFLTGGNAFLPNAGSSVVVFCCN